MSAITKTRYMQSFQQQINKIAQVMETSLSYQSLYTGRGYDPNHGGTDPIVAADVESIGITSDQVYSAAMLMGQIDTFFTPEIRAIINAVRNDK